MNNQRNTNYISRLINKLAFVLPYLFIICDDIWNFGLALDLFKKIFNSIDYIYFINCYSIVMQIVFFYNLRQHSFIRSVRKIQKFHLIVYISLIGFNQLFYSIVLMIDCVAVVLTLKKNQFIITISFLKNKYPFIFLGSIFLSSLILLYSYFDIGIFDTEISQRKLSISMIILIFLNIYMISYSVFIFQSTDLYYLFMFFALFLLGTLFCLMLLYFYKFRNIGTKEFTLFLICKLKTVLLLVSLLSLKYFVIFSGISSLSQNNIICTSL